MMASTMSSAAAIDREVALERYRRNSRRTEDLFARVRPEAYYDRPIPLRNPICFYEGHLPAFAVNTLLKRGLGSAGIDAKFEVLFERGIDPEEESAGAGGGSRWPARAEIREYATRVEAAVEEAITSADLDGERPAMRRGLALQTILEHDPMHQETLRYMWQRLPYEKKLRPSDAPALRTAGEPPRPERVRVPAGRATLGANRDEIPFGWDNEFPKTVIEVPAFEIDAHDMTNRDYLEFVEAGGYLREELWGAEGWSWRHAASMSHPLFWEREGDRWFWRGMFERVPLPAGWPVYVSHAEASAYARWKGRRLPTEAEYHRAAHGTPSGRERAYPWGDEPPDATRGNFDFESWDPVPVGSFPKGQSAWGVFDLVGNGWEWTSSVFEGFSGFEPMASYPAYSVDFFDGRHFVLKGGSPATAKELLRSSFRNWFRGNYPYVYATFRCASDV